MINGDITSEGILDMIKHRKSFRVNEFFKRNSLAETEELLSPELVLSKRKFQNREYAHRNSIPYGDISVKKLRLYERRNRKKEVVKRINVMKGFGQIRHKNAKSAQSLKMITYNTRFKLRKIQV